jgi:putative heme-binding domain-containing protein
VDLGHARFRQASTDADLIRIIRRGIPGTPMPPTTYTEFQAKTLVAYLRSMSVDAARSAGPAGDPSRGKALFEGKGECTSCHRVKGAGSRTGPDLSEIGALRRGIELERSISDPNPDVLPPNRSFRGVTRDGTVITGRLLNQDSFSIQVLDSRERLVSVSKTNLREYRILTNSTMPSYRDKMTSQELADLVSYLATLKGAAIP